MNLEEKTIEKVYVYKGRIINVRNDRIMLPDGKEAYREVVEHNGGVSIAALTPDNELLFVRQYRYPYEQVLPEIPAGKLEKGEAPEGCAARELIEETGYCAQDLELLSIMYPTPGYCGEVLYIYFARTGEFVGERPDEGEFLTVERIHIDKALEMVMNGEILDGKTQLAVLKLHRLLNEGNK